MRILTFSFISLFVLAALSCCFSKKKDASMIEGTGTIVFLETEGGFYGIAADDGINYDPINLAPEFKKDSLRIKFTAHPKPDMASFHMWGVIVEIKEIELLD